MIAYYMLLDGVYTRLFAGSVYNAMAECDAITNEVNVAIYRNNTHTLVAYKDKEWEIV